MTAAWACACLALSVVCLPGPPGGGRLRTVACAEATARASRRHLPLAAFVASGALLGWPAMGPAGAVVGALAAGVVGRRRAARAARATAAATASEVCDALRRITDELRSGAHPAAALDGVRADGPLARGVLADAAAAARMGEDVAAALRRSAAGQPSIAADLGRIADAWALADRHGIPLADLLAGARSDIAWRLQFGRRTEAQLAGPRATIAVLTALPAVGLLLGQVFGADPLRVLRDGVLGQILLLLGAGLTAAGFAWSDRILRSALPR